MIRRLLFSIFWELLWVNRWLFYGSESMGIQVSNKLNLNIIHQFFKQLLATKDFHIRDVNRPIQFPNLFFSLLFLNFKMVTKMACDTKNWSLNFTTNYRIYIFIIDNTISLCVVVRVFNHLSSTEIQATTHILSFIHLLQTFK